MKSKPRGSFGCPHTRYNIHTSHYLHTTSLQDELSRCPSLTYDVNDLKLAVKALQAIIERHLGTDTGYHDAFSLAMLVRRILEDSIADSRDTGPGGYRDSRDSLFSDDMCAQLPPGLWRAAGGGGDGEAGENDYAEDCSGGGSGGEGGGNDGVLTQRSE